MKEGVEPRPRLGVWVMLATFAVLAPTLRYGFVFDDEMLILGNVNSSWQRLGTLLGSPQWAISAEGVPEVYRHLGHFYRPVVSFSYLLDRSLFQGQAWGFHLTNCLMQACAAGLVYRSLRWFFPIWPAAILALAFGVHPSHAEVVAAIHGRTDLFATVFVLLALLLYQARPRWLPLQLWLPAFGLSFALALGSKEQSALAPCLFAALHLLPASDTGGLRWRDRWMHWTLVAALVPAYLLLRAQAIAGQPPLAWSANGYLLEHGLVELLELMAASVAPWWNFAHGSSLRMTPLALGLELLGCSLLLGVALWRRPRLATVGFAWFALCVLFCYVGASAVYGGELDQLSKRYAYMGLLGLLWVVGSALPIGSRLALPTPASVRVWLARSAGALLVAAFAGQALLRNRMYEDSLALWKTVTEERGNSELAYYNLGRELLNRGDNLAAAEALQNGIRLNPLYMGGYQQLNLITALLNAQRTEQAARVAADALSSFPEHPALLALDEQLNAGPNGALEALFQRALAAQAEGQFRLSLQLLGALHARRASYRISHFLAGYAHQRLDQLDQASAEYGKASVYTPSHPTTFVNLGYLYLARNQPQLALESFQKAVPLSPAGDANLAWGMGEASRRLATPPPQPALATAASP